MSVPKIWIQDHSWAGCLIAVAFSEEEARDMMRGKENYSDKTPLTFHDIMTLGLVHVNYGDL